ncbi:MAG: hypothetical protein WD875_10245 [Pirellulales bacterium]
MSVEIEHGRVVGLRFDGVVIDSALGVMPRLPELRRVSFAGSTVTSGIVRRLETIERSLDVILDEPVISMDDNAMDALADVQALRKLVLRGALIGEDVVQRFQQKRPDVEVVLEPAADEADVGRKDVAPRDSVQLTW